MGILRDNYEKIKKIFLSPMFGRFIIIGFINGFNGVFFSYAFSDFFPVNLSFVIGYIISVTISYFLNSRFVFKRRVNVERFLKYYLSYVPNFIIQNICVFIMFNCLGWHEVVSFILAAVFGVPITYIILNLMTFKTVRN